MILWIEISNIFYNVIKHKRTRDEPKNNGSVSKTSYSIPILDKKTKTILIPFGLQLDL